MNDGAKCIKGGGLSCLTDFREIWHVDAKKGILTINTVEKCEFQNPRWQTAAILKTVKSPYIRNRLTDFLPRDAMHPRYQPWACVCPSVCPSVRPSQAGVLLKRLNVGSHKQHHTIPERL